MKYTIINNNPNNFKVQYEIDGIPQHVHLKANTAKYQGMQYVRIDKHINVAVNPYGRVYGDGEEITQHLMREEQLFQRYTVDPLTYHKKLAGEILTAYYNNDSTMTVELFDSIAKSQTKKATKSTGSKK